MFNAKQEYNIKEVGGVSNQNKIDLSEKSFIFVQIGNPLGKDFVNKLKDSQNCWVLKPCWPKNGPTGGSKFASWEGIYKETQRSKDFSLDCVVKVILALLAICTLNLLDEFVIFFFKKKEEFLLFNNFTFFSNLKVIFFKNFVI